MNKNIGDYNSNILQLLHSNGGGHEYSLDDIASFVSENITGIFDRHYLRNRLFDLCRKGRIANPRMKIYSTPKQNPNLMLDIELMWDVFIDKAREYYLSGKHIPDVTEGKWRIERVVDVEDRACVFLISDRTGKSTKITHEHFENSLVRINNCGGKMERPDRRSSHRSAYCEFLPNLSFDNDGFTVVVTAEPEIKTILVESRNPNSHAFEWNVRRQRPIFDFDFEPLIEDYTARITMIQERHIRHEDLVDFVWDEVLGDSFDKKEGVFDLLSKNNNYEQIIWEMKTIEENDKPDEKRQVMKAVSQLFYYDFISGKGGVHPLIACFERKISDDLIEFLAMCNIYCCWKKGERLEFAGLLPSLPGITN